MKPLINSILDMFKKFVYTPDEETVEMIIESAAEGLARGAVDEIRKD